MRRHDSSERRYNAASTITDDVAFPGAMNRGKIWALVSSLLVVTCLADFATGRDIWFGPFYLLTIAVAAWGFGRRQALAVGFIAFTLIIWANGLDLYPLGTVAAVWNLTMRVTTVAIFIVLIDRVRNSYAREWRLARTDPLTGALNRQAFFDLADRLSSSKDWTMLAYADLDGLKKLNDLQGHAAGDQALIAYVAHVRSVIRKRDHFARFGGDEFVAHLRVRDEASARSVAERLHREMNVVAAQIAPHLKCSVGVLILPPGNRTFDREVLTADQLMYEAKQEGAGLVVATLRDIGGSQFLLHHWTRAAGVEVAPALRDPLVEHGEPRLDAAA